MSLSSVLAYSGKIGGMTSLPNHHREHMQKLSITSAVTIFALSALSFESNSATSLQLDVQLSSDTISEIAQSLQKRDRIDFLMLAGPGDDKIDQGHLDKKSPPTYRIAYRPDMTLYITIMNMEAFGNYALYWDTTIYKKQDKQTGMKYAKNLSLVKCKEKSILPLYDTSFNSERKIISHSLTTSIGHVNVTDGAIDSDILRVICSDTNNADIVENPIEDSKNLFNSL